MSLDITPEALDRLLQSAGADPVVIVNFVRLRPDGIGAYQRYGEEVGPIIAKHGGQPIYSGACVGTLIGDERWDYVAVVRYPGPQAIEALVSDPEFEARKHLRHAALEAGVVHVFR